MSLRECDLEAMPRIVPSGAPWPEVRATATQLTLSPRLTRYNGSGAPVPFESHEWGYMKIALTDSAAPTVNPVEITFVPDGKLSVNLLMEFKRLDRPMRLVVGRSGGLVLKMVCDQAPDHSALHAAFCLEEESSGGTMSMCVGVYHLECLRELLDNLVVVVSTNTFYHLDLGEMSQQAVQTGRSIRQTVAGWLMGGAQRLTQ